MREDLVVPDTGKQSMIADHGESKLMPQGFGAINSKTGGINHSQAQDWI